MLATLLACLSNVRVTHYIRGKEESPGREISLRVSGVITAALAKSDTRHPFDTRRFEDWIIRRLFIWRIWFQIEGSGKPGLWWNGVRPSFMTQHQQKLF
ncbi:hypothetical protein DPEC_G00329700 [Dallia pectoralis]|uniref:Uncharacterized protein n=1 Tax=Dallia pectoralis TaxID=75939 RepID=A0ACC2F8S3_DALPE|nr:hypothetical protein DPEC_G00329700 [Dallia pectoralis]